MRFLIFISLFTFLSCQNSSEKAQQNIVVLFTDDQRWNTIQAWGNDEIHTPNMDRLTKLGVSFTRAHVMGSHHGAVCAPSRAMLLTGKPYLNIPKSYIDRGADPATNFPFETFPEYYRKKGYQTFFTGKWHNHTGKLRQGFEDGKNIFIGGMHWPREGGHEQPWLWDYDSSGIYAKEDKWQGNEFSSKMYSDAAIDFLENRNSENPFCLYVAYTSPHDPRTAPPEYLALYDTAQIALPPNFLPEHPFDNGQLRIRDENLAPFPRTPEIVKEEIKGYYAMISEVDAQIGRILDKLEEQNLMENTIIVFAGDNGLGVGQHGLLGKQSLYEHSIRVPLIIAAPGYKGGQTANTLCYLYDIFPTLTELTGGEMPKSVEGLSLKAAMDDGNTKIRTELFHPYGKWQRAIKTDDDWKMIRYFVKGVENIQLFNLKEDPWETNNLADHEALSEKFKSLSKKLTEYSLDFEDGFFQPKILTNYLGFDKPVEVKITCPGFGINVHYSIDGSSPTAESPVYENPFEIKDNLSIRAIAFYEGMPVGEEVKTEIAMVTGINDIEITIPKKQYSGNGKFTLVDGIRGDEEFKSGKWLGYQQVDFEGIIDLGSQKEVSKVGLGYLINKGSWIFPPTNIEIFGSIDGNSFKILATQRNEISQDLENSILTFEQDIAPQEFRYVKFVAENVGQCPEWHEGAGGKSWIFLDELIVE